MKHKFFEEYGAPEQSEVFPNLPDSIELMSESQVADQKAKRPQKTITLAQIAAFLLANIIVGPIFCLVGVIVGGHGLQQLAPVMSFKLSRAPIPGAEMMRNYSGWRDLVLAHPFALGLFLVVAYTNYRLFLILQEPGFVERKRNENPVMFFASASLIFVLLSADALVFFAGITAINSNSFDETPRWIPVAATALYVCLIAAMGLAHADHSTRKFL